MAQLSLNLSAKHTRAINDFSAWLEAWTIYMGIVVLARPDRAHELVCYQHILCTANQQFTTSAVLNYDRAFRQHTASMALRWDVINQTLWSIRLLRSPRLSCTKCTLQNSRDRCLPTCRSSTRAALSISGGQHPPSLF
eukprot:scpid30843/ scgid0373/ 